MEGDKYSRMRDAIFKDDIPACLEIMDDETFDVHCEGKSGIRMRHGSIPFALRCGSVTLQAALLAHPRAPLEGPRPGTEVLHFMVKTFNERGVQAVLDRMDRDDETTQRRLDEAIISNMLLCCSTAPAIGPHQLEIARMLAARGAGFGPDPQVADWDALRLAVHHELREHIKILAPRAPHASADVALMHGVRKGRRGSVEVLLLMGPPEWNPRRRCLERALSDNRDHAYAMVGVLIKYGGYDAHTITKTLSQCIEDAFPDQRPTSCVIFACLAHGVPVERLIVRIKQNPSNALQWAALMQDTQTVCWHLRTDGITGRRYTCEEVMQCIRKFPYVGGRLASRISKGKLEMHNILMKYACLRSFLPRFYHSYPSGLRALAKILLLVSAALENSHRKHSDLSQGLSSLPTEMWHLIVSMLSFADRIAV